MPGGAMGRSPGYFGPQAMSNGNYYRHPPAVHYVPHGQYMMLPAWTVECVQLQLGGDLRQLLKMSHPMTCKLKGSIHHSRTQCHGAVERIWVPTARKKLVRYLGTVK